MLEDGRLTEAKGRTVDFRNTVVIMTSNVGADLIRRETTVGFKATRDESASYEDMKNTIMDEVKRTFRPEFLNRIDEIIVFRGLTQEDMTKIVDLMISQVADRLKEVGINLTVDDEAKKRLVQEGYDPLYGARPLRRVIQRMIEDPLSEEVLQGTFREDAEVLVTTSSDGQKIVFKSGRVSEPSRS